MKITAKQIRIIKMAQRQLGIDDQAYRDLIEGRFGRGVRSCTRLDASQAGALIDELQKKGFRLVAAPRPARRRRPQGGNVVALVTAAERAKIDALAALIDWRSPGGLAAFLEKRAGISGGRVRTSREAYLAIEALKKLFENGQKKQHGPDWWLLPHADPAVAEYVRRHLPEAYR